MEATNYLIVRLRQAYKNEVVLGDKSFIVNSTIENVSAINREAIVESAPKYTILKKGDRVVVHHNIFRQKRNYKGHLVHGEFHIEGDFYYVPLTEVFLHKPFLKKIWKAIDPYVFIETIPLDESTQTLVGIKSSYKGNEHKIGKVKYLNNSLKKQGLKEGDKIAFKKNSEYEFEVDGQTLYRMRASDVLMRVDI